MAEQLFVKGGHITDAIDMYTAAGRWEEAHKVSQDTMRTMCVTTRLLTVPFSVLITGVSQDQSVLEKNDNIE